MCNCNNCFNNLEHEEDRQRAIRSCLERNPNAFRPKIGKGVVGDERRHNKGCNCKRSGCLKNYCECYEVLEFILRCRTEDKRTVYQFTAVIHDFTNVHISICFFFLSFFFHYFNSIRPLLPTSYSREKITTVD
jgi:hypothetical protein